MATPHCAMAQGASMAETSWNACLACSYWKEWSRATARLKPGSTVFKQDIGKWTEPISSAESSWWCSCAASPREPIKKSATSKIVVRRIGFFLRKQFEITGKQNEEHLRKYVDADVPSQRRNNGVPGDYQAKGPVGALTSAN